MNAPNPSESRALAAAPQMTSALVPQNMEEALQFADYLAQSELVPKTYRGRPADCFIALAWGMEVNLKPIQAINSIATINGKPGLYGDAGKALLLSHGCIIDEDDGEVVKAKQRARCKITRPGRPPVERTFSIDDAKTANLWGKEGPWRTYPWRQMAWRAFWFAARDCAADLLRGLPGAEEVMDTPPEKHMGPAEVVPPSSPAPAPTSAPQKKTFPDESFTASMPAFQKAINKGKTPAEVLATFEQFNPEFALSEAQRAQILALKPAAKAAPASDAGVTDATPKVTYAVLAERMKAAADRDAALLVLDEGRALPADQQKDLQKAFDAQFSQD